MYRQGARDGEVYREPGMGRCMEQLGERGAGMGKCVEQLREREGPR